MIEFSQPRYFMKKRSFTLIELLVIIGIIGILVLISVPAFRTFQPFFQLSGTTRNLVSNLRYTQQLAVTEQVEYCLQLPSNFPTDKKYQIIQCEETQPIKESSFPDEIINLTINPSLTNNEVRYNSFGAVKERTNITLENTENKTKTIEVKPSGFVRITD